MDQIQAMRIFVRVVEAGTFTRAADSLGLPKGTVTKQIQALESRLHVKLLNRTTRRVTVTPDGAAYFERTARLLNDFDDIEASMTNAQANPKGRLRVDIGTSVARLLVIPQLAYHGYEGVALNLDERARLVADIGDKKLMLLRNHGTLAVGQTAADAFVGIFFLERACAEQVAALSAGRENVLIAPEAAQQEALGPSKGLAMVSGLAWPGLKRKLDRHLPGYDS